MDFASTAHAIGNIEDAEYAAFLTRVAARFRANTEGKPVFHTDVLPAALWQAYLYSFSVEHRQHHNCNSCRHFIERFGGLVTINADGTLRSAIWNEEDAPELYKAALRGMAQLAMHAKVTSVFLSDVGVLGDPVTGAWQHLHVHNTAPFKHSLLRAYQAMAEKREDFKNINVALGEFSPSVLDTALQLLETDSLYRSEKVIGPARWLRALHAARDGVRGPARANIVWLAIATAPAGFCHPRSSMIGTLLEDIAAGKPFDEVARSFKAKMHPLQYQRPQAAPAAGNIAAAEKLIEQMGLAPALERRIARLEEIPKLWEPIPQPRFEPSGGGVFGHLTPKSAAPAPAPMDIPPVTITMDKFVRTVIPTAQSMELFLSPSPHSFIAITTAVNPEAPPLLQWDLPDARNPFAWYVWHGGSRPERYGLQPGWIKVRGITRLPARWNEAAAAHHGDGLILLLEGARETVQAGNAIFPECLRSELHQVRSTIEAYSRSAHMHGMAEGSAIGIDLRAGNKAGGFPATVRVVSAGRSQSYRIDRWD
jgi:hypothetical protein